MVKIVIMTTAEVLRRPIVSVKQCYSANLYISIFHFPSNVAIFLFLIFLFGVTLKSETRGRSVFIAFRALWERFLLLTLFYLFIVTNTIIEAKRSHSKHNKGWIHKPRKLSFKNQLENLWCRIY